MVIKDSVVKELVILLIESDLDRAMAGNLRSFRFLMNKVWKLAEKMPLSVKPFYGVIEAKEVEDLYPASLSHHNYAALTFLLGLTNGRKEALCKIYIKKVVQAAGMGGDPEGIEIAHAKAAEEIYEFLIKQRR